MAITQLFFKKGNFISTIELDIIISESATATAKVTENPVEFGSNINDHIIIEPMTFSTQGVVSDISSSIIGQFTRTPTVFNRGNSKSREAWEALLELHASRQPFSLVQGLREYQNVVILSINERQDKDTSKGLFFNATMREIIVVGSPGIVTEQFNEQNISDKMVAAVFGGLKQLGEG